MRQSESGPGVGLDQYAAIAEYYDLEHDRFGADLDLIHELVEIVGDPVVELGCGTGRILEGIADLGMRMTGVDSSAAMLDRCRDRPALRGASLTLARADMASTGLAPGHFGIVLIGLSGLLHATTLSSQRDVLRESWRLLDPRGLLYVDLPNPLSGTLDHTDNQVVREGMWSASGGNSVTKFSSSAVDRAQQRISTDIWYDTTGADGAVLRTTSSFELRYIQPAELELMLELAGFVEWQLYGSYELDPFTESSARLIVMAEKSPSS